MMERSATDSHSYINMCMRKGARLENNVIATFAARSDLICLTICSRRPDCRSVNYHLVDQTCDINDKAATDYRAIHDFDTDLSSENVYYITSEC